MIFEVLENCLRVLEYYQKLKPSGIEEMVTKSENLKKIYVLPFRKELDMNILSRSSSGEKNDLIVYYISEFIRLPAVFPKFKTMIDKFPESFQELRYEHQKIPLEINDQYDVNRHALFVSIFNEIQKCCFNYKIPFLKICSDLFFPVEIIDYESAIEYKEWNDFTAFDKANETQTLPEITPVFSPESVFRIYEILKDYFSQEQQPELLTILQNSGNASQPLLFRDSGNRLADALKQLYDCGIIKGCQKKELETWIGKNFYFRRLDMVGKFSKRYLNDMISTNKDKCQNPILNTKLDKSTGNYLINKT